MNRKNIVLYILVLTIAIFAFGCAKQQASNTTANQTANSDPNAIPPEVEEQIKAAPTYAASPTESFKQLYAAVKEKDTEKIKSYVTKNTRLLALGQSQMQKKPIEETYKNGFIAATFAEKLPEMRDERIKDDMGAVEVWNEKESKWEDVPFIKEDGGWKLAVGDIFRGNFQSPGKGQAQIESEASNKMYPAPPTGDTRPVGKGKTEMPMMPPAKK